MTELSTLTRSEAERLTEGIREALQVVIANQGQALAHYRRNAQPAEPDHLYVIQQGDRGPVKIGRAKDPFKRMVDLQVGSAYPLAMRAVFLRQGRHERAVHAELDHLRMSGEWFEPDPELFALLERWQPNV